MLHQSFNDISLQHSETDTEDRDGLEDEPASDREYDYSDDYEEDDGDTSSDDGRVTVEEMWSSFRDNPTVVRRQGASTGNCRGHLEQPYCSEETGASTGNCRGRLEQPYCSEETGGLVQVTRGYLEQPYCSEKTWD